MASRYDAKNKCRVGTMDEEQFYAQSDHKTGAYFRNLLEAWEKAGGMLRWGAGGVGLRAVVDGREIGICFLAPAFGRKKDRIELTCASLRKQLGAARCDELVAALRKAAGDQVAGTSMISILQPGDLSAVRKKALTRAFTALT
ncbi:MAG: hypothetical protein V3W34_18065 [Phycisphaerae bacterium]